MSSNFVYVLTPKIEKKIYIFMKWRQFIFISSYMCLCNMSFLRFIWTTTTMYVCMCVLRWNKKKEREKMLKDLGWIWNKKRKMFRRFFTTETKCSYMARNKCVKWQSFCVRFYAHPAIAWFLRCIFSIHLDLATF